MAVRRAAANFWAAGVLALTVVACGGGHRVVAAPKITSPAYTAQGVWLGEPVRPQGTRLCGYQMSRRSTASEVEVRGVDCKPAGSVIAAYLGRLRAPLGWTLTYKRESLPPGGPSPEAYVRGEFLLVRRDHHAAVHGWLSTDANTPPPAFIIYGGADEVQFGCRTASSICK